MKSEVQKIRRLFDGIRAMDLTPDDLRKVGKYIDELEAENERLKVLLKLGTDFTLQGKGEQS